jgi:hypothetical protein
MGVIMSVSTFRQTHCDRSDHCYHSESDWRLRQTLSLLSQWVWLKVETDIITPITVSLTEGWDRHYHSHHSESAQLSVRLTVIGVIMFVSTFSQTHCDRSDNGCLNLQSDSLITPISESDWRLRQTLSLLSQWVRLKVETNIITPITVSLTEGWCDRSDNVCLNLRTDSLW